MDAEATPPPGAIEARLSPWRLFLAFNGITLSAFGGLIAVARHALVQQKKWMTDGEFAEALAIGQILPGPNVVNVSAGFGDRHAGWAGAFACVAGLLVAPTAIAIGIAALLYGLARNPHVDHALAGMAAAACGVVLATAIKLARGSLKGRIGLLLALVIFAAVALLRLPLALVLLAALPLSLWAHGAFRRLA